MDRFKGLFEPGKPLIGVLHLAPLPGSPGFAGSLPKIRDRAVHEAALLARAGYDGLIVENYGDLPFVKDSVGPETVAAMTVIVEAVKRAVDLPVGVNVLRNDYASAFGVASACGCEFMRINILVGAFVTPEGVIEGRPGEVLRLRSRIAPGTMIFADISVKHAHPIAGAAIDEEAVDAVERGGADCLIITGSRTGEPASIETVRVVRTRLLGEKIAAPVLVGSGVSDTNAADVFAACDGVIVGSYIRKGGKAGCEIDPDRARRLVEIRAETEG
jgi:membrane complex biogenesis BtpA family protein